MFEHFTAECHELLRAARPSWDESPVAELDELHLLIACCSLPECLGARLISNCGGDVEAIAARARERIGDLPHGKHRKGRLRLAESTQRVIGNATRQAGASRLVGSHHLVLGMLSNGAAASDILESSGIERECARTVAAQIDEQFAAQLIRPGWRAYLAALGELVRSRRRRG